MARLSKSVVKDPFNAFLLLRRTYKNWIGIIFCYFTRRRLGKAILKNGQAIPLNRYPSSLRSSLRYYHRWYDPSIYNLVGLARLLRRGWEIKEVQDDHALLSLEPSTVLKCRLNQGTDISLLGEIFIREVYGTDFQGKTIVDVGAYTADSAVYFTRKGAKLVIGLEPDPRNFEMANENVKLNRLADRVRLVNAALALDTGESMMGLNLETPNISKFSDPSVNESTVQVATTTLEDLMRRFDLESIDVLKMNCEGCEYGIIRNLSPKTFDSIGMILLEFHDGPRDLPEILSKHGFATSIRGGTFGYITATRTS